MIDKLPDLIVLKIVEFLKLPDLINFFKAYPQLKSNLFRFKKKFYYFDYINSVNHEFTFDLNFLENNGFMILGELISLRNSFMQDYIFSQNNNFVCYVDTRPWFILEYYINFFKDIEGYELPDFLEMEFIEDKMSIYGTMREEPIELKEVNVNITSKIQDYIFPKRGFITVKHLNNFNILSKIL